MTKMKKILVAMAFFMAANLWIGSAGAQSCPGDLRSEEWKECRRAVLGICAYVSPLDSAQCEALALQRYLQTQRVQHQPGAVHPASAWHCPSTHVIKGNFTTYSGERCIFHVPGGQFYNATKPEKCYRTPQDAIVDGCRASRR